MRFRTSWIAWIAFCVVCVAGAFYATSVLFPGEVIGAIAVGAYAAVASVFAHMNAIGQHEADYEGITNHSLGSLLNGLWSLIWIIPTIICIAIYVANFFRFSSWLLPHVGQVDLWLMGVIGASQLMPFLFAKICVHRPHREVHSALM